MRLLQSDIFDLYEKHRSTLKAACELAKKLNIKICRSTIRKIKILQIKDNPIWKKDFYIIMEIFLF